MDRWLSLLPSTAGDLPWALRRAYDHPTPYDGDCYELAVNIAAQLPVDELRSYQAVLTAVLAEISDDPDMPGAVRRGLTERYGRVLARVTGGLPPHLLSDRDSFGPAARVRLGDRAGEPATIAALEFASTLTKPVPTQRWLRQAAAVTVPEVVTDVLAVFAFTAETVHDDHDQMLRGLCWMASLDASDDTTELLAEVAEVAGEPGGRGAFPRAFRTAAAVVEILADRPGSGPPRALAWLSVAVRSKPLRLRVRAALDRAGAARGWAPGEAEELTVERHGLDEHGRSETVEIVGDKARALAPGASVREVTKTLAAERVRLEGLLAHDRTWAWETWQDRYLRHPVTGTIARRLLWQSSADGHEWVTGRPGDGLPGGPGFVVRLWHPVEADVAEVTRWRDQLGRQPFKQAFREVYRLTPAEEQAGTYSNRFAGHILRYRQAYALMRVRGWSAPFLGLWDGGDHSEATKELAAGTWQATFHHTRADEYCSTDQVRFARREGRRWAPAPLAEVPPRVLSEAMRDVDLFVGVTSIAADDTWSDRGEHPFGAYWSRAGFGALTAGAEVRRDALSRVLPRLAVADRCELTDRFLRVRGTRATYKIHLGSANILIEPADTYLCIVPTTRKTRVTLPFDDDERLSVILSKALLLAADDKITDPDILRQLPH
ncbi:DUF4132 domain-containing protein [Actinoplanes sp. TRM 88003]|uniref:DUF4132 domain-containing protein n=1 Tax=Paractinoplanes aksuensis TaxID=2939490 RepID=A0ABT1DV46_9ACTN|nr:DUF4132 domain-containing protein [Actinoplanes aksuensis]MCO8274722.1 DUF4132 domain-containing protein [Actinoplanes aksuensis]